ncbi:MAG: hypothetical protein OEV64_08635 [Desulfobulbaceae bacterium]|nr:hypothetical protein [Desulfobulbaceae bacterium]
MKKVIIVVSVLLLLAATDVFAKGHGKVHGESTLPPGLVKKVERGKELPPGWRMKLQKGEVLDERVYHLGQPVPEREIKLLPPLLLPGTKIIKVEDKIIRLKDATRTILDVFDLKDLQK